jgi:hypothetical protein
MKSVLCPECESCHNHLLRVHTFFGKDYPRTTSDILVLQNGNIQYYNAPRPLEYRLNGMAVLLTFECECGNVWSMDIHTEKGNCRKEIKSGI